MPAQIHQWGRALLKVAPFLRRQYPVIRPLRVLFRPDPEDVEIQLDAHSRMILNLAEYVSYQVYMRGFYEGNIVRLIRSHLGPGMTFFDIGAHFGQFTLVAAGEVGVRGSVHSFEPGPIQLEYLRRNVALNRFGQVRINACAVGTTKGTARLSTRPLAWVGGSRLDESGDLEVPLVSLDDYCWEQGIVGPDVIKLDAEGCEFDILSGFTRTLARRPPRLIVYETRSRDAGRFGHAPDDSHTLLRSFGYTIRKIDRKANYTATLE